uniref:EF-hand domain-containing protein n=1 Tax=Alexandrium monilatum TaxID=311494 RepID=A0A7S4VTL2_9DINO
MPAAWPAACLASAASCSTRRSSGGGAAAGGGSALARARRASPAALLCWRASHCSARCSSCASATSNLRAWQTCDSPTSSTMACSLPTLSSTRLSRSSLTMSMLCALLRTSCMSSSTRACAASSKLRRDSPKRTSTLVMRFINACSSPAKACTLPPSSAKRRSCSSRELSIPSSLSSKRATLSVACRKSSVWRSRRPTRAPKRSSEASTSRRIAASSALPSAPPPPGLCWAWRPTGLEGEAGTCRGEAAPRSAAPRCPPGDRGPAAAPGEVSPRASISPWAARGGREGRREGGGGGPAAPEPAAKVPRLSPEEVEQQRQKEEAARRKEAEERRRQEQKATLAIRRVIQKVRMATPENFDELQKELQEVLQQELEKTGGQKQRMTDESDKGLEQARKRIEQVSEQQRREQERREAEERQRRELEERARQLVAQLADLVGAAEAGVERMHAAAAPLLAAGAVEAEAEAGGGAAGADAAAASAGAAGGLSAAEAQRAMRATEEAAAEVRLLTRACTDFIMQKGAEMRDPSPAATEEQSDIKKVLAGMLQRINECTRKSEATVLQAGSTKELAVRRATARQKLDELEARFERYDKDADDMLSRREVLAYARGHFKCVLPEEALDGIWRHIVDEGHRGVGLGGFQRLNIAIGVARERQRDARRRVVRKEYEAVLKELKLGLVGRVREVVKDVDEAELSVARVEKQVQPLGSKVRATAVPDIIAIADSTDAMIDEARGVVGGARRQMDGLADGFEARYAADLRAFLALEAKHLEIRMGRMSSRLARATNLSCRFRRQAGRKQTAEFHRLLSAAARVVWHNQRVRRLTDDELFRLVDADSDGQVSSVEFLSFFSTADKDVKEPDLEVAPPEAVKPEGPAESNGEGGKVGASGRDEEGMEQPEVSMGVDQLERADDKFPIDHQPSDPKAFTLQQSVEEQGNDVELTPEALSRLFSHLAEGSPAMISRDAWLCIAHACYKVLQGNVLTSALCPQEGTVLRSLEVGEALEALEGPLREASTGMPRLRVRAVADGVEGWATLVGSGGARLLQRSSGRLRMLREAPLEPAREPLGATAAGGAGGGTGDECAGGAPPPPEGGGDGCGGVRGAGGCVRHLREGEILEPRAWPQREPCSGLLRMRVLARSDGAVGWLTVGAGLGGRIVADAV